MKTFILLCSMATVFRDSPVYSQVNQQAKTEQEVIALICHKWKVTEMKAGGKKFAMSSKADEMYLTFKIDGILVTNDHGHYSQVMWAYDHPTKTFSIKDDERALKNKITKITNTDFEYEGAIDGKMVSWILKRVD